MKLALRVAIPVFALGGLAAAAWSLWPRGAGDAEVPVHVVSMETFRREVPADGNLAAVQATPITAPQEARMPLKVAWMVTDGARVGDGEVVVKFDPSEMKDRLRDGRDSTTQVRKRIAVEGAGSGASQRRRDREAALAAAEKQAAEAREYTDSDVFSRNEIIESQIDRELASAKMGHAQAAKKIERSVSAGKLSVLKVQERQAEMMVDRAEKALTTLELTAPHAGILLLHRDWRGREISVGDTVWPGQKLAEIPEDGAMEAEVFVLEADGGALEVGMKATVALESRPGVEFEASIKRVETLAKPRVPEVPVQYFAVVLSIDSEDVGGMKIGQRVRARILLAEAEALVVPRQAVFTEAGDTFVYRRQGAGFERVVVELGPGTAGRVMIKSGLEAGDEVALRPPSGTADAGSGGSGSGHAAR